MISDQQVAERLVSIARRLRERGVKVGTMEIEMAFRLYKAAAALSGYNYFPLAKIVEAVFVKRDYERRILEEALRGDPLTSSSEVREKRELPESGRRRRQLGRTAARREPATRRSAEGVELLKRYLETENPGYLDMIREELSRNRDRGLTQRRAGGNAPVEKLVAKFALDPSDYATLAKIAALEGGEVALLSLKFLTSKKRRKEAEKLAKTLSARAYAKAVRAGRARWEKSPIGERIDLRKTLFLKARGKLAELAFKRKAKRGAAALVIDRSDSMRKHAAHIVEIASAYLPVASHVILFSDDVEVTRVSGSKSRVYLLAKVLDLTFHGYTNISKALRCVRRHVRPPSDIVLISDLQQTIRDSSPLEILDKLGKSGYRILVYTTAEAAELFAGSLSGNVKFLPLDSGP